MISAHNLKIIFASVALGTVLLIPDVVFGFVYEVLHGLYEVLEEVFDVLIEHLFDTGTHETQIIVFYLLLALIGYGLYRLWRLSLRWFDTIKGAWTRQKSNARLYWQESSWLRKTGIVAVSLALISFLVYWHTM